MAAQQCFVSLGLPVPAIVSVGHPPLFAGLYFHVAEVVHSHPSYTTAHLSATVLVGVIGWPSQEFLQSLYYRLAHVYVVQ